MKYLTLILLILTGCGKPTLNVDPTAAVYITRFEAAGASEGIPVKVQNLIVSVGAQGFEGLGEVGNCRHEDPPRITLKQSFWEAASDTDKEILMFHELGHCLLGRNHVNARSIMNAEMSQPEIYSEDKAFYIHELFHP